MSAPELWSCLLQSLIPVIGSQWFPLVSLVSIFLIRNSGRVLMGCRGNWDLIRHHDSLCDVLFSAAQSAALAPQKEMPSLIPGSCARPADVFLSHRDGGRPAALDVTIISSLQAATVADSAVIQGSALGVAEARKLLMHAAACHQVGVNFFPLAVEVLGGWSLPAVSIICSIGR
uniref:Uncharacterized protein n=1 Tax=Amphimedon queenslandica TaxID=400682 RepID=A0A1X7TNF8_AMPQE